MPPTQSTESTTWPWSTDSSGGPKQQFLEPATVKRFKSSLDNNNDNRRTCNNRDDNDFVIRKKCFRPVQGKITEYFKTHIKSQQKKCDISVKLQKNGTLVPINSNKLSVYLSGKCVPTALTVPVKEKLPDVFQREEKTKEPSSEMLTSIKESIDLVTVAAKRNGISCLTPLPVHRKTIEHENAVATEVTHIFRKPSSVPKVSRPSASPLPAPAICSINGGPSVSPLKPKTQSSSSPLSSVEDYPVTSSPSSPGGDGDDLNKVAVTTKSFIATTNTTCLTMNVVNSEQSNSNNNNSENCSEQSFVADKPSLPSPILSAPRTIRFPARNGWKGHYLSDIVCRWSECEASFNTSTALLEHLQVSHVNTQSLCESFVCLWVGCKVYERTSCSRSWLERHVLSHGGNKPYRCIVDGCGQRFSSQIILERHVNSHFNSTESSSNGGSGTRRNVETVTNKLFRRNGKKLRYRRQPFSARMFDYFDAGIMERLQFSLVQMTERRTSGLIDGTAGNTVTLQSKIIGQRVEPDGTKRMLVRWFPPNIVGDEWLTEKEVKSTQQVPLPSLSQSQESRDACTQALFRPGRHRKPRKQSVIAR